jgi:hypothetical protein
MDEDDPEKHIGADSDPYGHLLESRQGASSGEGFRMTRHWLKL